MLAAPWVAQLWARPVQAGTPEEVQQARLRAYRRILLRQAALVAGVVIVCALASLPPSRLGLTAPHSWWSSGALAAVVAAWLLWSAVRLQRHAGGSSEQVQQRGGALLPESRRERRWFAAVGLGGALSEELVFRGFLFYYFSLHLPALNDPWKVVLTSIVFAAGHLYQRWRGVAMSFAAGVVLAALYVLSGSLLLPVLVHAVGNLRGLLILRRPRAA